VKNDRIKGQPFISRGLEMKSEPFAEKKKMLKKVIKALHAGARPDEMKEKFKEVLKDK